MTPLIDTHQHLILHAHLGYGWTEALPELATRSFTPADYRAEVGAAVSAALFMEAGVDDADTKAEARLVAGLIGAGEVAAQIAGCRPEEAGIEPWLDECASLGVVGFRRILHVVGDDLSQSQTFRQNLRAIGKRGYSFDLCLRADQHAVGAELLRACPDQQFILDHCGNPDIAGDGFDAWSASLAELAAFPHLVIKLSGITVNARPDQQSVADFQPYLERMLALFGPDRMLWGGDWPVCKLGMGLPRWIETTEALLAPLSAAEQTAIARGTAQRVYRIG